MHGGGGGCAWEGGTEGSGTSVRASRSSWMYLSIQISWSSLSTPHRFSISYQHVAIALALTPPVRGSAFVPRSLLDLYCSSAREERKLYPASFLRFCCPPFASHAIPISTTPCPHFPPRNHSHPSSPARPARQTVSVPHPSHSSVPLSRGRK